MTFPLAIAQANSPDNRMRIGIVSSVVPFDIDVSGEPVHNPGVVDRSFGFAVGDVVALLREGQTWLVLGKIWGTSLPRQQAGSVNMTATAASSVSVPVVFATPFRAVPSVATNINSGSGSVAGWISRGIGVTTTGFTLFIAGASNTFTVPVQWQAQEMTQ
jgi:hypothetical protein